jgi:hypothetical protein
MLYSVDIYPLPGVKCALEQTDLEIKPALGRWYFQCWKSALRVQTMFPPIILRDVPKRQGNIDRLGPATLPLPR